MKYNRNDWANALSLEERHLMTKAAVRILLLGYSPSETSLFEELASSGYHVHHSDDKNFDASDFDLVVSYGYSHKILRNVLENCSAPIINLHIGFLPWNRGAHPNFWSHWDNTATGVTIHEIDESIDTGPIICQELVNLNIREETFESSYFILREAVEKLFLRNIDNLIGRKYTTIRQRGRGSFHKKCELPSNFSGWNSNILDEILRLERMNFNPQSSKLELIDKIEQVRTNNNINWMNLLRVVAEVAPEKLSEITTKINESDNLISSYFKQLGD
ncbi:MAG: hypothetical protein RL193_1197 [Actinomycetota bacterium]|jgi:folate-dependent phosphoribosylglycinamide formyltransferase PurN